MKIPKSLALLALSVSVLCAQNRSEDFELEKLRKIVHKEPTHRINFEAWRKDPDLRKKISDACFSRDVSQRGREKIEDEQSLERLVFFSALYGLAYVQVQNSYELRKEMLEHMEQQPWGVDLLFVIPAHTPNKIGSSKCPVLQLTADVPSDYLRFFLLIRRYYLEVRKEPEIWKEILNAPNTLGYTLLDYTEFIKRDGAGFIESQKEPVENLIQVVRKDGGLYVKYPALNKR